MLLGDARDSQAPQPPEMDRAEGAELRERVADLPDQMREVILLRYFEGMNEADMAEALDIARGTVKSRLHGAVKRLREGYGEMK